MSLQRPFSSNMQSGLKFQPTRILSKAGADKISYTTIANKLAQEQALSQVQPEGAEEQPEHKQTASQADLQAALQQTESVNRDEMECSKSF